MDHLHGPRRPVPRSTATPARAFTPRATAAPAEAWVEKANRLAADAHDRLLSDDEKLAWLAGRGITVDTVRLARLGWLSGENGKNCRFRAREAWGLASEEKDGRKKRLWIPRGLVIPWPPEGDVRRIRIRRPDADLTENFTLRYYVMPGSDTGSLCLPGKMPAFVIVEAELDAWLCFQEAGDLCGAAAMGSSSTKPDGPAFEQLQASACILNALDFDKAGAQARTWWSTQFSQSRRWPVPAGKDPGDAYKAGVPIREWILAGLPPLWTVGPPPGLNRKAGGAPDKPPGVESAAPEPVSGPQPDAGTDVWPELAELAELLRKHPLAIDHDPKRTRIAEDPGWASRNPEMSRRFSFLVFQVPENFKYIDDHPSGRIGYANFWDGIRVCGQIRF
ncbi:toprim domain-containing protein [uncultured Desulfosarcina sp.]|uniref:toprim domain-containing protein n=1 Tax=uncultured Desulfosarcina sp. TaxID=218289 RepID=UPI0029C7DA5A|nr:toprim domain-containing protein [uncultured Desulfosarcina sp.]